MSKLIKVFDSKTQNCKEYEKLFVEEMQTVEHLSNKQDEKIIYSVFFFGKGIIKKRDLSLLQLQEELFRLRKCKMVSVFVRKKDKLQIFKIISEVSRRRGICAPMLEIDDAIIYFPQLNYSDLGLLRYLCEKDHNMSDYKLLFACGD